MKRSLRSFGGPLLLVLAGGLAVVGCSDDDGGTTTQGAGGGGASAGEGGSGGLGGESGSGGEGNSGGEGGSGGTPVETVDPSGEEQIRVNQVGYLPNAAKFATVVAAADKPHRWELVAAGGEVVASGATRVVGDDATSGEHVHVIDFSDFSTVGEGYTLRVGTQASHAFDVSPTIYSKLKYDALAYFYHNRSGIEIKMPYAGGEQWTRPAGHLPDQARCGEGTGCDYTLDVTGGWYDAGDHGKYVVNGGISVWTLQNQYERFVTLGSTAGDFGDGKLNIPENNNEFPDLLDEARWELEFMLKMQVPDGSPRAGMVHHKIHDVAWTGLPLAPHEDTQERFLRPVSTAATLNLAATAAQAARLWRTLDPEFAAKCLDAAERAWAAAKANPNVLASPSDGTGGGAYSDGDVSDEFYWAAAELLLTTGEEVYRTELKASPYYEELLGANGLFSAMTWGQVDGLGAISLAVAAGEGTATERAAARIQLTAIADKYLEIIEAEGYRQPFQADENGYPWGSNSFVTNNMIVLALAHDFTGEQKYLDGVVSGMDYLLGRNAMDKCYVSGYGENPLENPHHRFWARQLDAEYPAPPPGAISGGPNSARQDPIAMEQVSADCAPQKCYLDHIEAWSLNEITINWNGPFAWVAGWLDEQAK